MRIAGPGRQHLLKEFAALFQCHIAQVVALEIEQVEGKVDYRRGAHQVSDGVGIRVGDTRLDQMELGNTLGIEHRDFAVDHCL